MRFVGHAWAWGLALGACLVPLLCLAAACGSNSSATPSPSPSLSGKAAIVADWQRFFSGTTPVAQKIALLQDGHSFAAALKAQASSPLAKAARAKVSAVTITSPTTATVSYSIVIGSQTTSATQGAYVLGSGQAVLIGGVWKVSAASFQAVLKLTATTSSSPSASP